MAEYSVRLCLDCVHCDIEHRWCYKFQKSTNPTLPHPTDRQCPHYQELFDAARAGYFCKSEESV